MFAPGRTEDATVELAGFSLMGPVRHERKHMLVRNAFQVNEVKSLSLSRSVQNSGQ